MSVWWLRRYGRAEMEIVVDPGEVVRVYYAPPCHIWAPGAIGVMPQKRNGLVVFISSGAAFLGVAAVILFAVLPITVLLQGGGT
jgi:hypothetical protein